MAWLARRRGLTPRPRPGLRQGLAIICAIGAVASTRPVVSGDPGSPPGTLYYSTTPPPIDHRGPTPILLARGDLEPAPRVEVVEKAPEAEKAPEVEKPPPVEPPAEAVPRLATVPTSPNGPRTRPVASAEARPADPIAEARQMIRDCRARYRQVQDYTCAFYKQERVAGRLTSQHIMQMKARTQPFSVYVKFVQPNAGREAIYVAGRNGGRALVHDVGIGKLLAGTLALDPRSDRAMEDCRHPITEAGIGHLIETVDKAWAAELRQGETKVTIRRGVKVGTRPCTLIESTHPTRQPGWLFHSVKLYIDREHGLPIRFEAYDWPRRPGVAPELVEQYSYMNLRLNVGLRDRDFDPNNRQYTFGRF